MADVLGYQLQSAVDGLMPQESASETRADALASARELSLGGLMIALGILVPLLFHFAGPHAGKLFLPMYLPVLVCGFLARPLIAAVVGFVTPLLSSALTGMPPWPLCLLMASELCALAVAASLAYRHAHVPLLLAAVVAMVCARAILAAVILTVGPLVGFRQHLWAYVVVGYLASWPGLVLQLTVVPLAVRASEKLGILGASRRAPAGERE